jgi:hypothetical protein
MIILITTNETVQTVKNAISDLLMFIILMKN